MRTIYALLLERWSKDLATSTAIGVTAGMSAALGDHAKPLDVRIDNEIALQFEQLQAGRALSIEGGSVTPAALPPVKRGPGRPPKQRPEGTDGAPHG